MLLLNNFLDIWHIRINRKIYLKGQKYIDILSDMEENRLKRFKLDEAKVSFAISHIALRLILSLYLNVNARDIEFTTNKYGKPELKNISNLHFNLSHTKGLAVLALYSKPVGIDIELIDITLDFNDIAKLVFNQEELQSLNSNAVSTIRNKFFKIWTKKEALLKGFGCGMNSDLIKINTDNRIFIDDVGKQWYLTSFKTYHNYVGHVAYQNDQKNKIRHYYYSGF